MPLSCQGSNNKKYNKTQAVDPVSGALVRLFHPRQDDWHEHFAWQPNCLTLIGLTPTGRSYGA